MLASGIELRERAIRAEPGIVHQHLDVAPVQARDQVGDSGVGAEVADDQFDVDVLLAAT